MLFQCSADVSDFFGRDFCNPPPIVINFQKCFMKIQYRELEGPAMIAIWGGWQKLQLKKSNGFFWRNFHYPSRVLRWLRGWGVCGWLDDENCDQKKNRTDVINFFAHDFRSTISPINSFENLFSIFWLRFSSSSFSPSQSQDPRIRNIAFSSNILRIKNFQKSLMKTQYCEFEGLVVVMEGSGRWKLRPKKSKTTKSVGFSLTFTNI